MKTESNSNLANICRKWVARIIAGVTAAAFLCAASEANAASAVNSSMSAATDDTGAPYLWQNPGLVFLHNENDIHWWSHCNNYADTLHPSQHLTVNGLGFTNIPSGSTINGIEVDVNRRSANRTDAVVDSEVRIIKGGTPGTQNKASAAHWPIEFAQTSYGGSSDLWGTTWSVSDINSSSFGFTISVQDIYGGIGYCDPDIEFIQVVVYFTPPPPDPAHSTLTPATATITANGTSTQVLTVQARDGSNNNLTWGGATVVMSKTGGGTLSAVTDNGNGTYTATLTAPTTVGSATITATMSGVAVGTAVGASSSVVTFVAGALDHFAVTTPSSPQTAGTAFAIATITAQDANNNTVTSYTGTVDLTETGGGAGGTASPAQSGPFTAGVRSGQSVTLTKSGTAVTITVTDHGGTKTGVTGPFIVNPGPASKLAFTTSPQTLLAGVASGTITVQRQDQNGNPVTSEANRTVTLSTTSGGGSFSPISPVTILNGNSSVNFTYTDTLAGTPIITAASTSPSTITSATQQETVNAPSATKLVFTTTAQTLTAGVASGTITVQRQDANNNPVTAEAPRTVTLSSSSTGTVTFSPTSLTIANGLSSASFTYTDTKAGTPTITAASTSPSTVTSATQVETVNPAAASKLVFTTAPFSVLAGVTSPTITVQRQDPYGNPNTADANRTVTLSSTSGGATFNPASPLTISSGSSSVSFTYSDTQAGTPTITAASTAPSTITSATQTETINPSGVPPVNGLVSYWAANGNAYDCVGGNNGTWSGTAAYGASKVTGLGQAFSLNGSSRVDVPDAANLRLGDFTISAWINWDGIEHGTKVWAEIIGKGPQGATGENYNLYFTDGSPNTAGVSGQVELESYINGVRRKVISAANSIAKNTWTHVAATYSSSAGTLTLYVNGTSAGTPVTGLVGYSPQTTTDPFMIGYNPAYGNYFGSAIDEVRVYNRALSSTEVGYLMSTANGAVSKCASTATANPTSGVAADGNAASTITVTALDANGNKLSGQTVTLAVTGTGNTVSTPAVTDVNGQTTATLKSTKAETKTITVTIGSTQISAQPTVAFIAGSASQTGVETAANGTGSVVGAQSIPTGNSITVYAVTRDANGNYVGNPSATWSLINKTGGVADGDLSAGGASATFTGHLVGSAKIQAVASGFTGQSGVQTVLAGALDHFAVTTPGTQTANSAFAITTITAQDINNNTVTSYAGTVDISETGGGAGGTVTPSQSSAFTSGVLSSQSVSLSKSGTGVTLTVTDHGGTKTGVSGTFTVNPQGVSAANSTATASPSTGVAADGNTTSTITVTARDAANNPISGQTVTLSVTGTGNTVSTAAVTDANGQTTATLKSTKAETKTITVTIGGTQINAQPTVAFVAGAATQTRVETAANGSGAVVGAQNVTAGSSITAYAIARDAQGNFVGNPSATWSLVSLTGGVVNGDLVAGGASAVFTGHLVGSAQIQAVANSFTGQSGVQTVVAGPTAQIRVETAANGSGTVVPAQNVAAGTSITVYAVARDAQGNYLGNPSATWVMANQMGGVVSSDLVAGDSSAIFTGHLVGSAQIQALAGGYTGLSGVQTVVPGTLDHFAVTTPGTQTTGTAFAITSITAQDAYNNTLTSYAGTVDLAETGDGAGGTVTPSQSGAFAAGILLGQSVALSKSGTAVTLTVTDHGGTKTGVTGPFTVNPQTVSAANSTATANPSTGVVADGNAASTITVTALDANDNPISGQTVTLSVSGGGNTISTPAPTGANGQTTATLKSTRAETKTITVTIGATQINAHPTVTFVADTPTQTLVETAADGSGSAMPATNVTAGSSVTLYAVARDALGNFAGNPSAAWSLVNLTGGVVAGDLVAVGGSAVFTGHLVGSAQIQAVANGFTGQSGVQTVVAGAVSQTRVETAADGSGTLVPAQNVTAGSSITVYAISRDGQGNFVSNSSASWLLANETGNVVGGDLVAGGASAVFTGHLLGSARIQAVANGFTGQSGVQTVVAGAVVQVRVETAGDGSGVVVPAQSLVAGSSVTMYAVARDGQGNFAGNPLASWSLTNVSGNVVSGDLVAGGGSAVFTGHRVGSAQVYAAVGGVSGQSGVQTVVMGSATQVRVETAADGSGTVVPAQGISSGNALIVYAITRDGGGNFLANVAADAWLLTNITGGVVSADLLAAGDHKSATFTAYRVGTAGVRAISGSLSNVDSGFLTVNPGAVSADRSTLSASPGTVTTDGGATSTLTVAAKDANNNVIPGIAAANVVFAATGTANTLVQPSVATDSNGQTTGTLASTKAETKTVSVTINGTAVTQTASVTFTAGAVSAANSTVSASPGSVTANGVSTSTITVTARDAHNNAIPGIPAASVVLAATGSENTLVQPGAATDANGQTTGTLASTHPEVKTVSVIIGGTAITQTTGVTFTPGVLDHFVIGAISSPQTAGTGFNIGITAKDANNNTVTGFGGAVDLSTTAGTISPTVSGSFVAGVLASQTVTVTGAGAGKTITATDHAGSGKTGTSGPFTVNVAELSPANSTISPASASKPADGVSTQVITVQARDLYNNNLTGGGATVVFSKTGGGTLSGTTDHGNGTYTATLTSPTTTGTATVIATIGLTQVGTGVGAASCVVTFTASSAVAANSALSPATASRPSDGTSTLVVTVQARDVNTNNLTSGGDAVVIFKQSGPGTLSATTDNGNGTYTAILTSPTTTGTTTLGATLNGTMVGTTVGASASVVSFVPGPVSASHSTVTADPTNNVTADGVALSTITVAVKDAQDNPIPGQTVSLSVAGHSYSISAPALTDANGLTSATIKSTLAETKTISASVGATNINQHALITFVAAAPNAFASSVSVSPNNNVGADGTTVATITVTLKDANSNLVPGQTVTVSVSGTGNTVSTPAVTDANGQTTATVSSTVAGTKTVTANVGSTTIVQQPTVTFVASPVTQLVFTTQPTSATYGSAVSPAVVVKTRDAAGNDSIAGLPTSKMVTLTLSSGTGSLQGTVSLDIGTAAGNGTVSFSNLKVSTAGSGKQLTASAAGLTSAVSDSFTITPLAITVTAAANTKVYDGTTNAAATPTVSPAVVSGDIANFTESYTTKTVGTGKTLTPAGTVNDGNSGNNYSYTFVTTTGVITAKGLTVSGVTANNKVYDGTPSATINAGGATLVGVLNGDIVTLNSSGATGTFADANATTGKSVSVSGLTLGGADGANYSLTQPTATADITPASTLSAVSSSANPALPGVTVTFTNRLSVVAPGGGTPTGSVTFMEGTNFLGTGTLNGSALASFGTNNLAHGSHVITAEYAGDGNFFGSTNTLSPNELINAPPSIGTSPVSYQRQGNSSLRVRISSLLTSAGVSDVDGDTFSLTTVGSPAVNGASVIINGSFLFYTPASVGGSVNDSFPYTVTDSLGGTSQGLVNVLVTNLASGIFQQVYAYTNGSILLKFDAIPNYSYVVQRATSANGPWVDLGTNTAAGNGLFQYVDPEPPHPQGFYRVRLP